MLSESRSFMQAANWLVTIPGLVILSLVLAFNLMGDGLRDALDPKIKTIGGQNGIIRCKRAFCSLW